MLRRFVGGIPLIGELADLVVMFFKYHFSFIDPTTGQEVGAYRKTTLLRDHYVLETNDDVWQRVDWRVLAALQCRPRRTAVTISGTHMRERHLRVVGTMNYPAPSLNISVGITISILRNGLAGKRTGYGPLMRGIVTSGSTEADVVHCDVGSYVPSRICCDAPAHKGRGDT